MKKLRLKINLKPWRRYILLGLAAYGIFLLQQLSATLPYALLEGTLQQNNVRVYGLQGTVWHGEMQRLEVQGRSFDRVKWELHPSSLLLGRLSASVSFVNADSRISTRVSRGLGGGISLSDLRGRIGASEVLALAGIPAIKLDGQFNLNFDQLSLDGMVITDAEGVLTWSSAGMQFPQRLQLGDLSARFESVDEGVRATLGDGGGALESTGQLLLLAQGKYDFNGQFAAREGMESSLGRALRMLGNPNAEGKISVKVSGSLTDLGLGG